MLRFFKKSDPKTPAEPKAEVPQALVPVTENTAPASFFGRLKQGLSKTRAQFTTGLASILIGKKSIDDDLISQLETRMLQADMGVNVSKTVIKALTEALSYEALDDDEALFHALQKTLLAILKPVAQPLTIHTKPFVILMVGVNGAGKTTTIGKLAHNFQQAKHSVILAAGDTFRAAAIEQLQTWGNRNGVPVISQHQGADSASVIFDALQATESRGIDILIADTAGRLHTQNNLMEEAKKIKRVLAKRDANVPHEVLLVLDATQGQNGLKQALQFHDALGVTGLVITKLDGTAKGGIVFAIASQLGLPIRYIGVGEGIEDLKPFVAEDFVEALLSNDSIC